VHVINRLLHVYIVLINAHLSIPGCFTALLSWCLWVKLSLLSWGLEVVHIAVSTKKEKKPNPKPPASGERVRNGLKWQLHVCFGDGGGGREPCVILPAPSD